MLETQLKYKKLSLTKTERAVLNFLLMKVDSSSDVDLGYSIYASDKKLQRFSGKSQQQIQRALRHLEELCLLTSSHLAPFRGTPVLFKLTFPQYCQVKRLVGRGKGDLLARYVHAYTRRTHNPISAAEIAINLRVKKRQAQRAIQTLVQQKIIRRTTMFTYSRKRRRYVKIPGYELTEGQKPITHWISNLPSN